MRLDIFLKNTGLIKQRSEAKRACDAGQVQIGGRQVKA
ncbi:MAG: RNA-binding S4 domain-containing protein, partial [Gemmatimonadetes bacterium]|nr:RNA-binding S4 domain-containing protein [Gemmatimonadota bacterium]